MFCLDCGLEYCLDFVFSFACIWVWLVFSVGMWLWCFYLLFYDACFVFYYFDWLCLRFGFLMF